MPTNNTVYMRAYYKKMREALIETLGGKCSKCEENRSSHLFFHHVNGYHGKTASPFSRGGMQQLYDIKNLIENHRSHEIDLRCREHHTHL
ncbi:unnamed protein product [marine sediment metagenome]|uniref:Uncharacterized protein n=1 Tax=marine sediment metagenome TaxID=412755 RepID=X1GRJ2_9ZZZZ